MNIEDVKHTVQEHTQDLPDPPASRTRVAQHTAGDVNEQIRRDTRKRSAYYAQYPERIGERMRELSEEWDVERTLELNASTLAFTGTVLGLTSSRGWLVLPMAVTGFLWQHAVQGWCPPLTVLRKLGFRTAYEIEQERTALKILRGDFGDKITDPDQAFDAARQ